MGDVKRMPEREHIHLETGTYFLRIEAGVRSTPHFVGFQLVKE